MGHALDGTRWRFFARYVGRCAAACGGPPRSCGHRKLRWRSLALRAFAVLLCALLAAPATADDAPNELSLLIWTEYLDPEVIAEFEAAHNVRIKRTYFESDDARDRIVQEVEGHGFDLALVNDVMVGPYAKRGWLAPIDKNAIPNLSHIGARWLSAYPSVETFGVPYFWGTLGIAYRRDLVKGPVSSWLDLFRPDESLRGRIIMIYDSRDTIGMALRALGHSVNSTDPEHLAEAGRLLEEQKPFVRSYSYVSLSETSGLVTGEFWMSMIYNGDAYLLKNYNENIEFIVPKEGTNLWTDYFVVFKTSPRKELAFKFLNFLSEPAISARLAQYLHYATPNLSAQKFLPPDFLTDPLIYPPPEVVARSETYAALPAQTTKARNAIFARLTH
ncbi:MAG: spermidine/putrescine ABC transporter substrate-binding protein [Rhodospirillales bacterium]|nr:spermidine/putrescine ABC transporter substrate-binding protein [Rhodospirillales bacterium]